MEKLKDSEYQCDNCMGVFEKGWSDEEAQTEYETVFTGSTDETAIVCDDCYKEMVVQDLPLLGENYL